MAEKVLERWGCRHRRQQAAFSLSLSRPSTNPSAGSPRARINSSEQFECIMSVVVGAPADLPLALCITSGVIDPSCSGMARVQIAPSAIFRFFFFFFSKGVIDRCAPRANRSFSGDFLTGGSWCGLRNIVIVLLSEGIREDSCVGIGFVSCSIVGWVIEWLWTRWSGE